MDEQKIKEEKRKLKELLKSQPIGSGGYNSVVLGLTRIVLEEFNNSSNKYSKRLIILTTVLIAISVVTLLAIIIQIYFAIPKNTRCTKVLTIPNSIEHCETTLHYWPGKEFIIRYDGK